MKYILLFIVLNFSLHAMESTSERFVTTCLDHWGIDVATDDWEAVLEENYSKSKARAEQLLQLWNDIIPTEGQFLERYESFYEREKIGKGSRSKLSSTVQTDGRNLFIKLCALHVPKFKGRNNENI